MAYNFNDQQVRNLVAHTHQPEELDVKTLDDNTIELALVCQRDRQPWPCKASSELAVWTQAHARKIAVKGGRTD